MELIEFTSRSKPSRPCARSRSERGATFTSRKLSLRAISRRTTKATDSLAVVKEGVTWAPSKSKVSTKLDPIAPCYWFLLRL